MSEPAMKPHHIEVIDVLAFLLEHLINTAPGPTAEKAAAIRETLSNQRGFSGMLSGMSEATGATISYKPSTKPK